MAEPLLTVDVQKDEKDFLFRWFLIKTNNCFPKQRRLLKNKEFLCVFRGGHRLSCSSFTFLIKENQSPDIRLGVVVPKKQIKRACQRNYVKRVIRDAFRVHWQHDAIGLDIIVSVRKSFLENSKENIGRLLEKQWKKVKVHYEKKLF